VRGSCRIGSATASARADDVSLSPASATATPTSVPPSATPPWLSIRDLPRVDLADVHAPAICDLDPAQAGLGAGEATIACSDGLALAAAVVHTVTSDLLVRVYLRRPSCVAVPCPQDELSTATVALWTAAAAIEVHLDSRLETVMPPTAVGEGTWPVAGSAPAPDVARPTIKGAPREIAERDPHPFCGRADVGQPSDVIRCFRAAVLEGRPVEMIEQARGTEGGEVLWIYRYDGDGRLVRFTHDQTVNGDGSMADEWSRAEGAMVLGIDAWGWDFDPWNGTTEKL
jgi:hypothetical protein